MPSPIIAITSGEPAGIGPEITLMLQNSKTTRYVILGDFDLLSERTRQLGLNVRLQHYQKDRRCSEQALEICHIPLLTKSIAGVLRPENAPYVLNMLDRAIDGCLSHEFAALVTAPLHKGVINDYGIAFSGHTEYLAERSKTSRVVMMLVGGSMRVALATTHLPLSKVAETITPKLLSEVIEILHKDLRERFAINNPRILVAGLNPHAGEGGHLGREEIEIINPLLDKFRQRGYDLVGALPADTLFNQEKLSKADAVLAMYHDQGLPVLKYSSFGHGVNVTLGLPIIRTSVDHGTALDLAGKNLANPGSLYAALALAEKLIKS